VSGGCCGDYTQKVSRKKFRVEMSKGGGGGYAFVPRRKDSAKKRKKSKGSCEMSFPGEGCDEIRAGGRGGDRRRVRSIPETPSQPGNLS